MRRILGCLAGAALPALALSVAVPAAAQQAGSYAGTTSDGTSLQITVGTDAATGALQVQSICTSAFTAAACQHLGYAGYSACAGPGSDVAGGKASLVARTQTMFVTANFVFTRRKLHGHVTFETPILSTQGNAVTADICGVSEQSFLTVLE
jgi:hypothetical protein